MLIRYQKGPDGKPVKKAVVYTRKEHGIDPKSVDLEAYRIVERLWQNGHEAYLVGGAVRDLILGRRPKDYDIVTDAQPQRIRKLFYRSRIIGKRFRLVHVYVGATIYEVSTFRSIANGTVGNTYGTMDEDALRRDFSLNALYFDPIESLVVDYVNGLKDIKAKKLVPVIPLASIFAEDPVRMLRAVKYAVLTGFRIPFLTSRAIKKQAGLLKATSVSRLGEEAVKILASGRSREIITSMAAYKLLSAVFPAVDAQLAGAGSGEMLAALDELDAHVQAGGDKTLRALLAFLLKPVVERATVEGEADPALAFKAALDAAREFLLPLTMPRVEVEAAVVADFKAPPMPAKRIRKSRPRKRRTASHTVGAGGQAAGSPVTGALRTDAANACDIGEHPNAASHKPTASDAGRSPGQGISRSAKRRRKKRESGDKGAPDGIAPA